jgi:hypothetical protein
MRKYFNAMKHLKVFGGLKYILEVIQVQKLMKDIKELIICQFMLKGLMGFYNRVNLAFK